ncbi:DUF4158 domain-containing protein [Actinomadura nitritigenes]|uniref:DUF4158 domain-containing protein n=1 Tax=Actinomadura nitritigenes TaxID=134602 RepID=UPI003D8A0785
MRPVFLSEKPTAVPDGAVGFVGEQLGVDPAEFAEYGRRAQTVHEHAWEIRELLGYRAFADGEAELRRFVAARVWSTTEGPRALFDRAVVHLVKERVLLPGITVLTRLVGEVRRAENARLYGLLAGRTPAETAAALRSLLRVPGDRRVSELERLRPRR